LSWRIKSNLRATLAAARDQLEQVADGQPAANVVRLLELADQIGPAVPQKPPEGPRFLKVDLQTN
jgi:hypothetical protein